MKYTFEILKQLGIDKNLIKLSNKEIEIPYISDSFNSPNNYWYPHPPALIPVFLGYGASYYGYLKHWFIERKETYVEYVAEWGYMLEYARNSKQFLAQMILNMDMIKEGLDDKILDFTKAVDFQNPQAIDSFAEQYGNDTSHYDQLETLNSDTPLTYVDNLEKYTGDFPSSETLLNTATIHKACSYEITKEDFLKKLPEVPEWLHKNTDKKILFTKFIAEDNPGNAWLTLNSKGWQLREVAAGLDELKNKSTDSLFQMIADNWIDGWQNSNFVDASY